MNLNHVCPFGGYPNGDFADGRGCDRRSPDGDKRDTAALRGGVDRDNRFSLYAVAIARA